MPPPTPTSTSPARICASRMPTARTLEAQTLLIVSELTSFGIPALICAWREGIWPCPACSTWPMITCWTSSPPTSARSSAALIAIPPSSVASSVERPPPIFPMGVRAEPRMTVFGMDRALQSRGRQAGPVYEVGRTPENICAAGRGVDSDAVIVQSTPLLPAEADADTVVVGVLEDEQV